MAAKKRATSGKSAKKTTKTIAKKTTKRNSPVPRQPAGGGSKQSAIRNTPVPRQGNGGGTTSRSASPAPGAKRQVTSDQIAKRAFEIWQSGKGGSEMENWLRAERELRG